MNKHQKKNMDLREKIDKQKLRIIGLIICTFFTLGAYFIIVNSSFFYLTAIEAISIIFVLALLQSIVQLVCFIDLFRERGSPWNLSVFISTVAIIVVIIFFSIWIMHHLDYNMMPWLKSKNFMDS